jgi:hypothetical protein
MTTSEIAVRRALIAGYSEMVQRRIDSGWKPHLVTFMFKQLSGKMPVVIGGMKDEIERAYSTFITRVVRDPNSPKSAGQLPVLVAMADLPTFRRHRGGDRADALVNGGLHYHGVLLVPPASRLQTGVDFHFFKHRKLYLRDRHCLDRIHVLPIVSDPARAVGYALKGLANGRLSYDDCLLVLPRTAGELNLR